MEIFHGVLLPILIGAIAIASYKFVNRFVMKSERVSPLQFSVHSFGLSTIFFAFVYICCWGFKLPDVLPGYWRAVLLGTVANFFIQYLITKTNSYKKAELSLTSPLQAMTPLMITVFAIVLKEYPSRSGVIGILLMSAGSYILLWNKTPKHWWEYFGPFRYVPALIRILPVVIFKTRELTPEEETSWVVNLAILIAIIGTFGLLFDGLYTRRGQNLQGLSLAIITMFAILSIGYAIWYFLYPDNNKETQANFGFDTYRQAKYLVSLVALAVLWLVIIYTIQPTFNHTYVAYTATLKRLSILVAVLMGIKFFHEEEAKKRIWAAIIIIAGVILISTDDLPSRISAEIQGWGF
jgi:drug/metabolite transporter (DMT)-like permease